MKAAKKPTRKKATSAPLKIYSLSLTAADVDVLDALAQAASDELGRAISRSTVLRAILQLVKKRMLPEPAITETIEREVESGRKWGKESPTRRFTG